MSAILGIYNRDGQTVEIADLDRMLALLSHRGSDGVSGRQLDHVALGHCMQYTTSESFHERLPVLHKDGQILLTADARLDNRDDLIRRLGMTDRPAQDITDSDIILAAYAQWGAACPKQLLGDFAFAIWDNRKQQLLCARDHFGVKPLYYYVSSRLFVFATEIKALLSLHEVPRRLNELRVAEHLTARSFDVTSTSYQDIMRLAPAHTVVVAPAAITLQPYWSPDPSCETRLSRVSDYAEAFREHFTTAVDCRLRSAVRVGSMLSGGLDSSSIACVAQRLIAKRGGEPLTTFSAVYDTVRESDEREFIQAVLNKYSFDAQYLHADQISPLTDLACRFWHEDEAFSAGSLYVNWSMYKQAKECRVGVVLDGFDGDTTVSHGGGRLYELAHGKQWITLARELRTVSRRVGVPWKQSLWQWLWQYGVDPMIEQSRALNRLRSVVRDFRPLPAHPVNAQPWGALNPDFVRRVDLDRYAVLPPAPLTEREQHYRLLTAPVLPNILEMLDRSASAFGVELRFPFWDKRLIEFCLSLPAEQKMNAGWTRLVLRRAMDGIIPPQVQWRGGKANHGMALDHGLLAFERSRMDHLILEDTAVLDPFIDITALQKSYQRFIARTATEGERLLIWRSVALALWLQHSAFNT
ncbi:MAG: lasso peptide isopeptide bond-forming cyclase [Herpetosiphon sp.]